MTQLLNLNVTTETLHVDVASIVVADINLPWALLATTVILVVRGVVRAVSAANQARLAAEAEIDRVHEAPLLGVVRPYNQDDADDE